MIQYLKKELAPRNPLNLIWVVMGAAVVLTGLLNYLQGLVWYGQLSYDLMIIGTIDSIVVSLVVAPLAIQLGLVEQQRVRDQLNALALTDELTKLNNRRGFFLLAEQLLKMSSRTKNGVYLMYADLDDLKSINDTFGHKEGDRALKAFAHLLRENYRESDIIARIGGDEFVLLPVGSSRDGVNIIGNRFNTLLSTYNRNSNNPWTLSAAFGLAYFDPALPSSLDELLDQADANMYQQKMHTNE
ncbi:MAG: GGDEF domain-containing protein [Chloroflexota bacterium]